MGLYIYNALDRDAKLNGTTNIFRVTFDGRVGGAQAHCVYLRNNDPGKWYNEIKLTIIDTSGDNLVDGSVEGYSWKLLRKDIAPTELEWRDISEGNTLVITEVLGSVDIGDIVTFLPVWVRIEVPRGIEIQRFTDIVFRLTASENIVHG